MHAPLILGPTVKHDPLPTDIASNGWERIFRKTRPPPDHETTSEVQTAKKCRLNAPALFTATSMDMLEQATKVCGTPSFSGMDGLCKHINQISLYIKDRCTMI